MGYGRAAALGAAVGQLLRRARGASWCGRLRALKSRQERGSFGRFRSGGEDRLLVGLQDGKPGREILRVIRARASSTYESADAAKAHRNVSSCSAVDAGDLMPSGHRLGATRSIFG